MKVFHFSAFFAPAVLMLLLPVPVQCEEFPFAEYEQHVERYFASLENLAVDFTTSNWAFDGSFSSQEKLSLISIQSHFRTKTVVLAKYKDGTEVTRTEWSILRPDGYWLINETDEGKFVLKKMLKKVNTMLQVEGNEVFNVLMRPLQRGFVPLISIMRGELKKTHSLKASNFQRHPGKGDAAFTFHTVDTLQENECDFILNEQWLVTSMKMKSSARQLKTDISYTKLGERVLPTRISSEFYDASGGLKFPAVVTEIQNYREYNGSLADFSVAQFGLPEIVSQYQQGSRWYLWFLGMAVVSLGAGWYFWRRAQRRSVTPTPR